MALSNEDKKDVRNALGKRTANEVSKVTRDKGGYYTGHIKAPSGKMFEITKPTSTSASKAKALKSKMGDNK